MQNFRKMAAAMDQRMRQLEKEGVTGGKVLERMMGHLPDLQRIWEGTNDQQLAMLCEQYPGFYTYASLMEEAAEEERGKPNRTYLDLPELDDSLKPLLTALLTDAATLERGYQAVLEAKNRRTIDDHRSELDRRHRNWLADHERLAAAVKSAGVPKGVLEVLSPVIEQMTNRIAQLRTQINSE